MTDKISRGETESIIGPDQRVYERIRRLLSILSGPGSSVGIATDYGLDGPGSNPGGDDICRPSRPAMGPTQPPAQRVPCLSRGQCAAGACC